MVTIEFDTLLRIQEDLGTAIDLSFVRDADSYELEYLNLTFSSLSEIVDWVRDNEEKLNSYKILLSMEHLLDKYYFDRRFKDKFDTVYFIRTETDAIIMTSPVTNSQPIDCSSFEIYVQQLTDIIFK